MPANELQIGGDHYQSPYQHWDLCIKIPLAYLEGCTTKHVARWRKKLGIQDLRKALHYLDKLIEVADYNIQRNNHVLVDREVERFVEANGLTHLEYQYFFIICTYRTENDLWNARQILTMIINSAKEQENHSEEPNRPGTPGEGGHHARS